MTESDALDALGWELLARHFADVPEPGDLSRLKQWVGADVARHREIERLRKLWEVAAESSVAPAADVGDAWTAVVGRLDALPTPVRAGARRRLAPFATGVAVAAAAVLLASIVRVRLPLFDRGRVYTTERGQRETVTLSDGTQIMLAPASTLRLGARYASGERTVSLDGAAYFVVAHDAHRPFSVHVRNAVARDLGTRFVVESYPETPAVRVVVADGAVELSDSAGTGHRRTLTKGTLGLVTRSGVTSVAIDANADADLAWTTGELVFRGAPLRDVLAELGRWYDLDVRLGTESVGNRTVTASFRDEPADNVLTLLAATVGTQFTRRGRAVVFAPSAPGQP